jgi:hypothetical protein
MVGIGIKPPDDSERSGISVPYYINTVRCVSILLVSHTVSNRCQII